MIKKIIHYIAIVIYFIFVIIFIYFVFGAFFWTGMGYRDIPKEEIKTIEYIPMLIKTFIYILFASLKKFYFIGAPAFLIVFIDLHLKFKNKNPTNKST